MKVLFIDMSQDALPAALRARDAGHEVKIYCRPRGGKMPLPGRGMVPRVAEWEPHMRWADLILLTGNSMYAERLEWYFDHGFPIIGANKKSAALELDRGHGEEILQRFGIPVIPSQCFDGLAAAIEHVKNAGKTYVVKTWGGTDDKASSFVSSSPADMVFTLEKWRREGKRGQVMLQEKVKGIEMACAGWFGPGGFSEDVREIFEEKKFLNDGLGQNTGEMGTIMRYTRKSKLFERILRPLEGYLAGLNYVGNVDVNCIIDEEGTPWPLEFTTRFGWPGYNLEMALHTGDPVQWLRDLWDGRDTLRVREGVCVGVVMAHGDFPMCSAPAEEAAGYPITGITAGMEPHIWPHGVMYGQAPIDFRGGVTTTQTLVTAEQCVMTVTGVGPTVEDARTLAYDRVWKINWPSNRMFRTDIGKRLEKQLPTLHSLGYAKGLSYA